MTRPFFTFQATSSGAATAKRPASIASDSDSAFYASDGSLEPKTSQQQQQPRPRTNSTSCRRFFELKHYLEVITQAESRSIAGAVLEHLGRLLHVCPQYRAMVFLKIVVPFLDDKSMTTSSVDDLSTLSDVDVCTVGHCLGLVCRLLEHPDMLEHCHRQKVLQMVVSFRSTSELIENVYQVLRKYLECAVDECCRMRTTFPPLPAEARHKLSHDISRIKSEEMELPVALTDEEVFQPEIQKALLFGSIVKEFHDIVLSRTVYVLDVKVDCEVGDATFVALKELCCVWQIQSHLVEAFSEYQDYAKARGITRLVESLLDKLLEILLSPASSRKSGIPTASAVGHLISILVEFVAARELNESALSGPSEYFDEAKILDDSLRKISETLLRLESADVLRKVVSCIISAACSRQPFEGRTRVTLTASGSADDLRSIASSKPSSSLSSTSEYSCDADASDDSIEGEETTAKCDSHCKSIKSAKIFIMLTQTAVEMLRCDLPLAVPTASYLFHNLQRLESGNAANRNVLAENGTTSLILNHLQELTKNGGLCREVIRLLVSLGIQRLERSDLRLFMEKFKDEKTDQRLHELLLKTISDIASNSYDAVVHLKIPGSGGKQDSVGFLVDGASVLTSTPEKSGTVRIDMVNAWSLSPLHFDLSSTCTNRLVKLFISIPVLSEFRM